MIHVALASIRSPLEKGRALAEDGMRRRRIISNSPKHADVCVGLGMIPLVQIVPLRGTPSRPIGRPLLQVMLLS